jgi:hypothetical protein
MDFKIILVGLVFCSSILSMQAKSIEGTATSSQRLVKDQIKYRTVLERIFAIASPWNSLLGSALYPITQVHPMNHLVEAKPLPKPLPRATRFLARNVKPKDSEDIFNREEILQNSKFVKLTKALASLRTKFAR